MIVDVTMILSATDPYVTRPSRSSRLFLWLFWPFDFDHNRSNSFFQLLSDAVSGGSDQIDAIRRHDFVARLENAIDRSLASGNYSENNNAIRRIFNIQTKTMTRNLRKIQ